MAWINTVIQFAQRFLIWCSVVFCLTCLLDCSARQEHPEKYTSVKARSNLPAVTKLPKVPVVIPQPTLADTALKETAADSLILGDTLKNTSQETKQEFNRRLDPRYFRRALNIHRRTYISYNIFSKPEDQIS